MKSLTVFRDVPLGIESGVEAATKLPPDVLAEICQDVVDFLQYKINVIPYEHYKRHMQRSGLVCDPKLVFNVICFIYRTAAKEKLTSDKLKDELLLLSSVWKDPTISVISRVWNEQGKILCSSDLTQVLSIGQLVDMKWKLSVGMSSSCSRSLNAPYITIILTIADSSGSLNTHTAEMTVTEFKKFSMKVKEMSAVLDTV